MRPVERTGIPSVQRSSTTEDKEMTDTGYLPPQIYGRRAFLKHASFATIGGVAGYLGNFEELPECEWSQQIDPQSVSTVYRERFESVSTEIYRRHWEQTHETVSALKKRYERPTFGRVDIFSCLEKLSLCIDPTDTTLYCTDQLIHTLQVLEAMEEDGITDPDMLIAAIVHDLGKVLLLTEEAPENIVCANRPIGEYPKGIGLENVVFQWNHDEFIYERLKDYLPHHVGWLIRFHSISFRPSQPLMDERDREYFERYLKPFRRYDQGTKSVHRLPSKGIRDYSDIVRQYFPPSIVL